MSAPFAQRIVWTALPAGVEQGRLKLSVFCSPQLFSNQAAPPLSAFADFVDWPAAISACKLGVVIGGQTLSTGIERLNTPESALWKAVLPGNLHVSTYAFESFTDRALWSYPVGHIADWLKKLYAKIAVASPEEHVPTASPLWSALDDAVWSDEHAKLVPQLTGEIAEARRAHKPQEPDPARDLMLVRLFHGPKPVSPVPLEPPDLDFHEAVAALGHHPRLLRRLGLVIDLLLPIGPGDVPGQGEVRIVPEPKLQTPSEHRTPRTRYRIAPHPDGGGQVFVAVPRGDGPPLKDGLLNLADGYGIVQFDPDGAALQILGLAETHRLQERQAVASGVGTLTLPTLRSAGIQVYRTGLAWELTGAFAVQQDLDTTAQQKDPTIYAEDVTRGWLFDVFDATSGKWFSLCRRQLGYALPGGVQLSESDETQVSVGITSGADDSADMAVHEILCRWDGWSLVAPRPGKTVDASGKLANQTAEPIPPLQLNVAIGVPDGSLPRLRFGRTYRLRARAVDLAGNALPLPAQPTTTAATPPLTYRRFEPVNPPVLVPTASLASLPAEKVDVLVLRSNAGVSVETYSAKFNLPTESARHLVPPRASVELAETHGMLDGPTVGLSKLAFDLIKAYEANLPEVATATTLAPPYLVDPLARGVCFRGLPGVPAGTFYLRGFNNTDQSWPKAEPFWLRIVGGPHTTPQWDAATRTLTISLAPAETRVIRLSCHLTEADLDKLAIYDWITAETGDKLKQLVLEGRHWMLTPYREIKLVHAVQQPLATATVEKAAVGRQVNDTAAKLVGYFRNHAKSTGRIDLLASWTEPLDDLAKPTWETVSGSAHVHEQVIEYPADPEAVQVDTPFAALHEFGDTKYRQVSYQTIATTRYREFLPITDAAIEAGTEPIGVTGPPAVVEVPSSARPAAPEVVYVIPTFRWQRQKAGQQTTSERRGGLRVYLQRPWFSSGAGELLAVVLPDGEAPESLRGLVSYWGNDPIWGSTPLPSMRPTPESFGNPAAPAESGLGISEVAGQKVRAVPFKVEFDSSRGLWFADMDLAAPGIYWPFVRLALARYQLQSINKDVKLSRIVVADYAQLAPDRFATLTREGANLTVSLSGPTWSRAPDDLGGAIVEAEFEQQLRPDETGWVSLGAATTLPRVSVRGRGYPTWRAVLPVPNTANPLRLVIREFELLPSDDGPTRRLVYAEALAI